MNAERKILFLAVFLVVAGCVDKDDALTAVSELENLCIEKQGTMKIEISTLGFITASCEYGAVK